MSEATQKFIADMAKQLEQYLAEIDRARDSQLVANDDEAPTVERKSYLRLVYSRDDAVEG